MKQHNRWMILAAVCLTFIVFIIFYIISSKMPMQELRITAMTTDDEFDMMGTTNLYYLNTLEAGANVTISVKFMAVEDTSKKLFTKSGNGQYVYLGCGELTAKHEFISLGRFLHVKLTIKAAQADLKLEDGTPFDITRYSLRPVFTIED